MQGESAGTCVPRAPAGQAGVRKLLLGCRSRPEQVGGHGDREAPGETRGWGRT